MYVFTKRKKRLLWIATRFLPQLRMASIRVYRHMKRIWCVIGGGAHSIVETVGNFSKGNPIAN